MKKVIAITISLCLIFCSVVPCFAATDVVVVNFTGSGLAPLNSIMSYISAFSTHFTDWFGVGANTSGSTSTWNNFYTRWLLLYSDLDNLIDWLVPSTAYTSSDPTLMDSIIVLTNYAMNNLPYIPSISSYVSNFLNSYNNTNNFIRYSLGNILNSFGSRYSINQIYQSSHTALFSFDSDNKTTSYYNIPTVLQDGNNGLSGQYWNSGTALGNIALLLKYVNDNIAKSYTYRWSADLTHYNDTLSTWDSQDNTLTQVNFTPDSAIQGLYRYLAFTQRDVARLAHVYASDEEINAREKARTNQTEVMDDFIDANGAGSVSASDFGNIANFSSGFKTNFDTGVSGSGIWDVFDNSHYSWFTQATKNSLDTTQQTRGEDNYPTPLLDVYYAEIMTLFGGDENR